MAAKGGKHTAEFFKKDKENNVFKDSVDAVDLVDSVKKRFTIADDSDNKLRSVTKTYQFNNEDKIIARLYREVIDKIMTDNKFGDMKVTIAISKIKEEIHLGHKRGFRKFPGINFGKPENRCAYLIRYAICYTGLVKKAIWDFFNENNSSCPKARDILTSNHRKVVSLGGGPGNDLIGFCSALQESSNNIEELDLKIVDINDGWISVFPEILRKASKANFGSLSALMRRVKINTGFLQRNLSEAKIFEDVTLSNILDEVDIVLMVKLVSFLPKQEVEELIQNVVDCMKEGAYLIFIDCPFGRKCFRRIQGLDVIYEKKGIVYELSFKPSKYHSSSISKAEGNVCVFCKIPEESTSEED